MKILQMLALFLIAALLGSSNSNIATIHIPAAGMKGSVREFQAEFSWLYSHQSQLIPIASLMYHASVLPVSVADAKVLVTTASGKPRTASFADGGKSIVSDGQTADGIAFPVLLSGTQSTIGIDFPAHLVATVNTSSAPNATNAVTFSFAQPLAFHLDKFRATLPVPRTLYLEQVVVSDQALVYRLADGNGPGASQYTLSLDLGSTLAGAQ